MIPVLLARLAWPWGVLLALGLIIGGMRVAWKWEVARAETREQKALAAGAELRVDRARCVENTGRLEAAIATQNAAVDRLAAEKLALEAAAGERVVITRTVTKETRRKLSLVALKTPAEVTDWFREFPRQ